MSIVKGRKTAKITSKKGIPKKSVVKANLSSALVQRIKNTDTSEWIYVVPRGDEWIVRRNGAETRALAVCTTKNRALSQAKRELQLSHAVRVVVFDKSGNISQIITK